jgi:hypothetical protein
MANIQFSSALAGTNPYTLPYNPVIYNNNDDYSPTAIPILHGAPAYQSPSYDGRTKVLRWEGNLVADTNIVVMLTKFYTWKGHIKYVKFQDISTVNHVWPNYTTWNKILVVDVRTQIKRGGRLDYEYIELVIISLL